MIRVESEQRVAEEVEVTLAEKYEEIARLEARLGTPSTSPYIFLSFYLISNRADTLVRKWADRSRGIGDGAQSDTHRER